MRQKRSDSAAEASTAGSRSMASEPSTHAATVKRTQKSKLNFEHRVFLRALLIWLPSFVLLVILCWRIDLSPLTRWTVVLLLAAAALAAAFRLKNFVLRPLRTLSNMLSAIREEDYSVKARGGGHEDALSQLVLETNALAESLRERQYRDIEAGALMKQVMTEIDVAIFIFDLSGTLRLINRAGEELIGRPAEEAVSKSATELGLADYLNKPDLRDAQ